MLTADSITDQQIADGFSEEQDPDLYDLAVTATHAPLGSLRRMQARSECARILNARAAKESK